MLSYKIYKTYLQRTAHFGFYHTLFVSIPPRATNIEQSRSTLGEHASINAMTNTAGIVSSIICPRTHTSTRPLAPHVSTVLNVHYKLFSSYGEFTSLFILLMYPLIK